MRRDRFPFGGVREFRLQARGKRDGGGSGGKKIAALAVHENPPADFGWNARMIARRKKKQGERRGREITASGDALAAVNCAPVRVARRYFAGAMLAVARATSAGDAVS